MNCANFWGSPSPAGNCPTPSSLWKRSCEPASENSKRSPSANNLPAGSGKASLRSVTRVDAHVFRGKVAGPITRRRAARVQIHQNVHMLLQQAIAGHAFVEI